MVPFQYRHFTDPLHREAMKEGIRDIIDFSRENDVGTVVVAGPSGLVARELFKVAWKKLHPEEKMPQIRSLGTTMDWSENSYLEGRVAAKVKERLGTAAASPKGNVLVLDENAASGQGLVDAKLAVKAAFERGRAKPSVFTAALLRNEYCGRPPDIAGPRWGGPGPHRIGRGNLFANSPVAFGKMSEAYRREAVEKMRQVRKELAKIGSEVE